MLKIYNSDALTALREMASESVHCVVTSPPYWGLRSYCTKPVVWDETADCDHKWDASRVRAQSGGTGEASAKQVSNQGSQESQREIESAVCSLCGAWRGEFGLEPSHDLYVQHTVQIMRQIRRVLRPEGTVWLNLGDSYAGQRGNTADKPGFDGKAAGNNGANFNHRGAGVPSGLKAKDLVGIPWRVAFALQGDGWWLRSDIIWNKPNPMPESVTDRPTKSHEYIFLLSKSERYFFDADAIKEPATYAGKIVTLGEKSLSKGQAAGMGVNASGNGNAASVVVAGRRNVRSVWTITSEPYPDAHFATFPTEIPRRCILAGTSARGVCPECGAPWTRIVETEKPALRTVKTNGPVGSHGLLGGARFDDPIITKTTGWRASCEHAGDPIPATVLDPCGGSGTTGKVAIELGRKAILIERKAEYCEMIESRTKTNIGLPLT